MLRRQRVPSEEDWGNYQTDLDQNHAHQRFAKRTNQEIQPHFKQNPLALAEDLHWMPKIPFQYYMVGFRDFIETEDFGPMWSSDAASSFLNLVLNKLENHPDFIVPIMPDLISTIEFVANHQARFKAEEKIYGNFKEKLKQIRAAYFRYTSQEI